MNKLFEDVKFVERFLEKYLGLKKGELMDKVIIKLVDKEKAIYLVENEEIVIKFDNNQ